MKEYQTLLGAVCIAAAILISGILLSNAVQNAGVFIGSCTSGIATSIISAGAQVENALASDAAATATNQ